jgi:hypothetical protein
MTETPANENISALRHVGRTLKGLLLWHYDRGSWQYDVMVVLILAFVFLIPVRYFHDRPVFNPNLMQDVVQMGAEVDGILHYRVSAELLALHYDDPHKAAEEVFADNLDHPFEITRIEAVRDSDEVVVWYDVWLRGQK